MVHHSSRHSGRRGAPIRNLTELKKIPGSPHSRRPGMAFGSAQQDVDGRVNSGHDDGEGVGHELSPSLRGATATKQSSPRLLRAMNWIASLRSQ
jgi:hypothetical protein